MYRSYVMVCSGQSCGSADSDRIADEFEIQIKMAGLRQEVQVLRGGCLGICASGPNVAVFPEGTLYSHVHIADVVEIVSEHLLKGERVERLLFDENEATGT
ncbi:MAG: (2Fe-2S) ferredoxin domain-containing protein, partial [Pygmaiobacter sp.]